jgi:hypothetical protein
MCEKCNKNFAHAGKLSGQMSTQNSVVELLEKLPFIWMGEKQLIQVDKREVINLVQNIYVKKEN